MSIFSISVIVTVHTYPSLVFQAVIILLRIIWINYLYTYRLCNRISIDIRIVIVLTISDLCIIPPIARSRTVNKPYLIFACGQITQAFCVSILRLAIGLSDVKGIKGATSCNLFPTNIAILYRSFLITHSSDTYPCLFARSSQFSIIPILNVNRLAYIKVSFGNLHIRIFIIIRNLLSSIRIVYPWILYLVLQLIFQRAVINSIRA